MSSDTRSNTLLDIVSSVGGIKIEIWSLDLAHAISGHPEVTLDKVRGSLTNPCKVIQSKSSPTICLFYSIELTENDEDYVYFCVVVGVKTRERGKLVTAYDTNFIKTGRELFSREGN